MNEIFSRLKQAGIQPSAQRLAIAKYVLRTTDHPAADDVWRVVQAALPMVSRATVYNTLNLFVEKGLLRAQTFTEGRVVFDPNTHKHHHFIDDQTGEIEDIPWEALEVSQIEKLEQYHVAECQVILRGTRKASKASG